MENTVVLMDKMQETDWQQVRDIYIEGIDTGNATFEKEAPTWEEWDKGHISAGRLVVREGRNVIGWAALSPVSSRCAYAGVAEVSIYLSQNSCGKGIGSKLLKALIEESEANGIWTLQSGIFPENTNSIRLHTKFGFKVVGQRERIGKLNGIWRDVSILERRSRVVGIE
ncbi:phosphinothricin N-acetyltransferase [Lentibacillus populi]|uniref:Phosphinothricin N-acetyltransferase n=1 Tax=Lentibacillus populi TaxID=1827502 RepID=A0A9W5U196_9BACI|nr:GNAT family N-acetyltransferase [Lentibacillus populi]GGB58844.1 phosphinothricin N-acetyltransferase [Lentibacillus populi]